MAERAPEDEARARIETLHRDREAFLDLSNLELTALPNETGNLTALGSLNLYQNQLTALPNEIGNLAALETLNLGVNRLTALPREIGK